MTWGSTASTACLLAATSISLVYSQWNRLGESDESEESEASTQGYAKMYYPGTPEAAQASTCS
jgi:hypothetical protein